MSHVPELRFSEFASTGSAQVLGEWEEKKLGDVTKIQRGRFSPRPRNDPRYYGGNIPFIQTSDVVNSRGLIDSFSQTLNEEGLKVSKLFPKGTILITIAANIGYAGVLQEDMACPDSLIGLSCNKYSFNYFLNYILEIHQPKMDYLATAAAQKNINVEFLKPYKITIPSLPEQQKIATFLSAVDKKLGHLRRKHELLESYKRGIMQKIFPSTGTSTSSAHRSGQAPELRFKQDASTSSAQVLDSTSSAQVLDLTNSAQAQSKVVEPESSTRAEPVEAFPDWEEKRLGDVSDVRDGTHDTPKYVTDGFPLITSKNLLKNGELSFDDISYISKEDYVEVNKRSNVSDDDIIFGMIGTIGNPVMVKSSDFAIKNVALIKQKDLLLNSFLIHFLNSSNVEKQFHRQNAGGTQKFIALGLIRQLLIEIPSLEEQQKIANFLSTLDKKLEAVQKQIDQTEIFKKGLLQKMFV